jgi:hypothetical protein
VLSTALFVGPLAVLALVGLRRAPIFLRRCALILPPFVIAVILYAKWWEVRTYMTMYPVLASLAMYAFAGNGDRLDEVSSAKTGG